MACSHYISGASKPVNWTGEPHATVKIKLDFDGSVVVLSGAADIGQGSSTILVQTVAEVLGLDISRVRVVTGDSEVVPKDNGSYSSRVTFMVGNAAIDAAQNLKRVLVAAAARKLEAKPEEIECLGELYRAGAQDKGLTFNEVVTEALKDTGTITVTGSVLNRSPIASAMALVNAGRNAASEPSPASLAPNGPCGSLLSMMPTSIGGESSIVGTR